MTVLGSPEPSLVLENTVRSAFSAHIATAPGVSSAVINAESHAVTSWPFSQFLQALSYVSLD